MWRKTTTNKQNKQNKQIAFRVLKNTDITQFEIYVQIKSNLKYNFIHNNDFSLSCYSISE